jgi:hypothetical protein
MYCRFGLLCAVALMISACQTTASTPPKLPGSYNVSIGQSVSIYKITQPALQIGDNRGNLADIEAIPNRFYAGLNYNFPPIKFVETPSNAKLEISANSVFGPCDTLILINQKKVGKLKNGRNSFDIGRDLLLIGNNVLGVAADGCDGYSGDDDILIREVTLFAK